MCQQTQNLNWKIKCPSFSFICWARLYVLWYFRHPQMAPFSKALEFISSVRFLRFSSLVDRIFSVHFGISDLMWFHETDCVSRAANKQQDDKKMYCRRSRSSHHAQFVWRWQATQKYASAQIQIKRHFAKKICTLSRIFFPTEWQSVPRLRFYHIVPITKAMTTSSIQKSTPSHAKKSLETRKTKRDKSSKLFHKICRLFTGSCSLQCLPPSETEKVENIESARGGVPPVCHFHNNNLIQFRLKENTNKRQISAVFLRPLDFACA